ncbi:hypothetical protein M9H77_28212 [Catharanthus roseus]|uniref:Uncharacterized protein n=1 Tax=Catharanthus roseus TaxID=4058 RepID=A0ACC0AFM3_CATRO|nr:hypothetical protein M9H77_28212 [Catharanthus roseus]
MPGKTRPSHPGCPLVTLPFNPYALLVSCAAVSLSLEVYSFSFSLIVGIRLLFFFFFFAAFVAALLEPQFGSPAPATINDFRSEGTVEFLRSGQ